MLRRRQGDIETPSESSTGSVSTSAMFLSTADCAYRRKRRSYKGVAKKASIVIVLLVVGYILLRKIAAEVFAMFLAGNFDYDVSGKVMVIYPMHDLPWYRPPIVQRCFCDSDHRFNAMLKLMKGGGCQGHSCPGIFR